jgi:hypothetical protein
MKTFIITFLFLIALSVNFQTASAQEVTVSFQTFYDELSP